MGLGDEITLPVYLVRGNGVFASSEITLIKQRHGYAGSVGLKLDFLPGDIELKDNRITIPLYLVTGSRAETVLIGDFRLLLLKDRYEGLLFIDISNECHMQDARSLVNVPD